MSLLYNKIPDAYITVSCVNTTRVTKNGNFKPYDKKVKSKNRRHTIDFSSPKNELWIVSYCFMKQDLRIINIGKNHVVYQLESRNGTFGLERTSKLITKGAKIYFEHKNRKFYLKKANMVL